VQAHDEGRVLGVPLSETAETEEGTEEAMATEVNALLLLPPEGVGNLTSIEGTATVPWEPNDPAGFTLHELGQRFRRMQPVVAWLRERGLEIEVERKDDEGTWFRLTSLPDRVDRKYAGDDPTWWRR
jgi:hypothetical protein